ncbi:MAG: chromosome segregation protein SMC [Elusimicrobiales bacterium]|nr:chromosome segregation protein SMC [Elusimicrobiales bacterium]
MYLKYIELYGFKSFANRTKIELYPGINIIVGPNGCGKSNIVDAIKWSIGEMSRKALRMPSMTDVIFAGTSKRQQMNLAEVTLIFDNVERKLPIAFDEVAITRKIYRNEESEYFINRTSCRLKDIREMFLDTGIGSNGYAIIDQGEIEEILLADAIERREVFEEVAGISRYKAKREETLSKLDKVSVDLSIVENSVALIEQQIKKLEQDAKKANLQQKCQQELREIEIAYTIKSITELYAKIDEENHNLEPIIKEISDVNLEISQLESEKSKKDLELLEKSDINNEISDKIVSTKINISQIEGKIISDEELIKEIKSRLDYLTERHAKNSEIKNSIQPKINEIKNELESLYIEQQNIENKSSSVISEYNELEMKIRELDEKIVNIEKQILEYYQNEIYISNNLARLESEMSHIDEDILSASKDREKIYKNLENTLNEIREFENELFKLNELKEQAQKELSEILVRKQHLEDEFKNLESENERLSLDIVSLESRLNTLIKDAQKDSYWTGTQAIIESGIDGIIGVLRNMIKFKGEKIVLEDIFGESLDSVIVKDRDTAFKCIEYLKQNSKGRARFLSLSNVPQFPPLNSALDDLFEVPDNIKNLLHYLIKDFTINGTTVVSDIWVCGGTDIASSNEPYWAELDEIKSQIETRKATKNSNIQKLYQLESEISTILSNISSIENQINDCDRKIAVVKNNINNIDEKRKNIQENISFIDNEIKISESKKVGIENKIIELKNGLEKLRYNLSDYRNTSEGLKKERLELEKLLIDKKELVTLNKHQKDSIYKRIISYEENLKSLEKQLSDIISQETEYINSKSDMEFRVKVLDEDIYNLKIKREELLNDMREFEIERSKVETELNNIRNYLAHLSTTIKENNEILREKMEKKNEIDLRVNTYKTRIEDLKNKLEMEYGIFYDVVKDNYKDYEVDPKRVEYLKKKIESIGPVNMAAQMEYEELMKDYEDKMKQINDLKQAREDLKEAISKINQTTKESLKSTFDKVNEHFKKIYSTLFNGGTSNLVFTDPDNILESGIEIMACPPGKKLVNISQLSGGEKSLTAIALLFSFFCVNPSPFCVMDEVDAALDESNVERFVNLLKEFSPTTQFVVITHNKRTMEVADRIYGVTMEEMGVSKIISVDLKKAINMIENVGDKI